MTAFAEPRLADVFVPANHPLHGHETAVQGLRECGREFHRRNWSLGTSSNYSVVVSRNPLQLVVTASGKHKERLRPGDFVKIDEQGRPIGSGQPKSSAETLLHCVVAKNRPEVGAILHTHSVWATTLSNHFKAEGHIAISGFEMLKGLAGITTHETTKRIEIFDNTQDIPVLAAQVEARLLDSLEPLEHGYLIHQHGLYTWGKDLDEARRHIEILEFLLECTARNLLLPR